MIFGVIRVLILLIFTDALLRKQYLLPIFPA